MITVKDKSKNSIAVKDLAYGVVVTFRSWSSKTSKKSENSNPSRKFLVHGTSFKKNLFAIGDEIYWCNEDDSLTIYDYQIDHSIALTAETYGTELELPDGMYRVLETPSHGNFLLGTVWLKRGRVFTGLKGRLSTFERNTHDVIFCASENYTIERLNPEEIF